MPNGTYEVTTWAGDLIAGNGTNFDIEGTAFAGPRTSTGVVHEQYFPAITVSDGQLNVRVTGGDGRVNGIRVQTPLAAPAGLAASDIDAVNETITLGWQPVTDATGYVVFRSAPGGELAEIARITDAATTTFADDTVALGESYDYAVATVKGERVSRPSDRVAASVVDPDVAKPAAPTGIETAAIDRNSVTLSWADPGDAVQWKVFRTTREDIPFEQVGTTTEPTFTDTDVLTTRPVPVPARGAERGRHVRGIRHLRDRGRDHARAAGRVPRPGAGRGADRRRRVRRLAPARPRRARPRVRRVPRRREDHRRADHGRDEPRRRRGHVGQHLPRDRAPGRPRDLGHRRVRRVEPTSSSTSR